MRQNTTRPASMFSFIQPQIQYFPLQITLHPTFRSLMPCCERLFVFCVSQDVNLAFAWLVRLINKSSGQIVTQTWKRTKDCVGKSFHSRLWLINIHDLLMTRMIKLVKHNDIISAAPSVRDFSSDEKANWQLICVLHRALKPWQLNSKLNGLNSSWLTNYKTKRRRFVYSHWRHGPRAAFRCASNIFRAEGCQRLQSRVWSSVRLATSRSRVDASRRASGAARQLLKSN